MRAFSVFFLLTLMPTLASAGALQDELQRRWHGAWVILDLGASSDCEDFYTNNAVSDRLVQSDGAHRLEEGELGQVQKVDVKRSRIDVLVDLDVPLRIAFEDGPFELFRQGHCRVELQVDVPRQVVKAGDPEVADEILTEILDRFVGRDEAHDSESWNGRREVPFPADYDETLAAYEEWRAEQLYAKVVDRLASALDDAARITDRVPSSPSYALGLASGLRVYSPRYRGSDDCWRLADESFYPGNAKAPADPTLHAEDWERGYRDGQVLAFSIDLARRLENGCL